MFTMSSRAKLLSLFLLIFVLLAFAGAAVSAQLSFPKPKGAVNDFAGVIDASSVQKMENLSYEVLEKTGTSIVVAVVQSLDHNTPEDYANRLYQAWGIGKKGEDKGALIFLALKERKVRIETGYGVERILPDGRVGEILDRYVMPSLREGKYGTGLLNGVAAMASVIAKDAGVTLSGMPSPPKENERVHAQREEEKAEVAKIRKVNDNWLKLIGIDEKTGTRFSIIDKSGGMAGTDPCKGGWGNLDVIVEVPTSISLKDDAVAQALVEKGKNLATQACPKFSISPFASLDLKLFKDEYNKRSEYEVYARWKQDHPRDPVKREYQNRLYERAKLEADISADTVRPLPGGGFLVLLGVDTNTGVKFWNETRNQNVKCGTMSTYRRVIGEVPNNLSLLDERVTSSLLIRGAEILLVHCMKEVEKRAGGRLVNFILVPVGYKTDTRVGWGGYSPIQVQGEVRIEKEGFKISSIRNFVLEAEQQRLKAARKKEQQEKERKEVTARLNDFITKNKVKEWVALEKLCTNPFAYEGKTVGIVVNFFQMLSATKGLFGGEFGRAIVVSDVPRGLFTSEASVVLAGRVLGNIETKLPLAGTMMVPHLKFVGIHICKYSDCRDIIPTEKKSIEEWLRVW